MATVASQDKWHCYPHHEFINRAIVDLIERRIPERVLVIECPPRHGKSELASHWLPAWYVINSPDRMVGVVSYESKFARSWGRKARQSFLEVAPLFGLHVDPRRDSSNEWGPHNRIGGMMTAGIGGPLTGRGFGLLVVDDPVKNAEEAMSETTRSAHWDWWESTALTRLDPDGVAIVMATRWHNDDLIGRILKASDAKTGELAKVIRLPALAEHGDPMGREIGEALWPAKWPVSRMEEIRATKSPYWWQALYQQRPSQHESAEWPEHYFAGVMALGRPDPDETQFTVLALDPSMGRTAKSDYSAFVAIDVDRSGVMYVSADLKRRDISTIVADGIEHCRQFQPLVWAIEGNGFAALRELIEARSGDMTIPMATVWQHTNKLARIRLGVGPALQQRNLRFVESDGMNILLGQLKDFPLAQYDDGPDALEMAIRVVQSVLAGEHIEEPPAARVMA